MKKSLGIFVEGGQGSGNFGHSGRPGEVGGSGGGGGGTAYQKDLGKWGHAAAKIGAKGLQKKFSDQLRKDRGGTSGRPGEVGGSGGGVTATQTLHKGYGDISGKVAVARTKLGKGRVANAGEWLRKTANRTLMNAEDDVHDRNSASEKRYRMHAKPKFDFTKKERPGRAATRKANAEFQAKAFFGALLSWPDLRSPHFRKK